MKVWIYLEGKQQGPFEMEDLASKPGFDKDTRVWFEGLPKWYPAGSLTELQSLFSDSETETTETISTETAESSAANLSETAPQPDNNPFAPGRMYRRPVQPGVPCPPTYLGWPVFLIICCCSPVSLAALAASICVSTFYGQGNLDKAKKASEWAAWLVMISFALGMIPMMIVSAIMG